MSEDMFHSAWIRTGSLEKGYVNDPKDSGGETNMGITVAVARAHGYQGAMKDLPPQTALDIAKQAYWDILSLDDVGVVSQRVADELFDIGFLAGIGIAGIFFQRALNVFSRPDLDAAHRPYAEVTEDGHLGKMSVYAFQQYMKVRAQNGEVVMLRALACQHGARFIDISRANPNDGEFVFGWFFNRITI